eukprot:CAMPEP_0172555498 /NCGR_PEP_ID=MMETSP1067-20121228/58450_1 /TAXON_ID=265564 ORGANISM="Thalassiosira punctigera, Strain Tpunct2005C2" /NCGR_SAMPLE_ID=MMETSP1067 /ASSEMBLY_ACC=CAM_ASM_000444 /LENGTH=380 /DNA_ID=CAMNT_0013344021 /DNA_START=119 /DNA_END=1261 /DNA_ORIENTATION=+
MDVAVGSKPKRILVTGSSGYVGQHLIASLGFGGIPSTDNRADSSCHAEAGDDDQQYEIFCAYNSLPTFEDDLKNIIEQNPLHPSLLCVKPIPNVDFSDPGYIDVIREACGEEVDAIIHLAALSSPGFCEKNASVAWEVNCPVDLLRLNAPIIYMSTDQVYEGTKQFYEEDNDETVPVNVYGKTKLAFERVLLRAGCDSGPLLTQKELGSYSLPNIQPTTPAAPNSVILRSSLILGPPTPFKKGCKKGAFPSFLQFIESRLLSSTSSDYFVNEFRSVVHITDVIRATKHFLCNALSDDASPVKTRVFNLGGSTRASRYDIALEVANHLKCDSSSINAVDRPKIGGGVPSPPDISMNVDKITKELVAPKMDGLKEIMVSTFK